VKVVNKNGSTRSLDSIKVRATEFIQPNSMPAILPTETAFTYCIDISVDGVSDDENITFEKPLTLLVDNFLNFPVGAIVPVGYYDRNIGEWVASHNGVIVKLLDKNNDGKIDAIDKGGNTIKINDQEVIDSIKDNSAFKPNQTYQLVFIKHFTPWDCNFPYAPDISEDGEAEPKEPQSPFDLDEQPKNDCKNPKVSASSYCAAKSRQLHDDIAIAGTDIKLHYSSKKTDGYKYAVETAIDTRIAPSTLESATATLEIAGNKYAQNLAKNAINNVSFVWDGKDILGNKLSGEIEGKLTINYCYKLAYYSASKEFEKAWARAGAESLKIIGREKACFPKDTFVNILTENPNDDKNRIANGWSIEDDLYLNMKPKGKLGSFQTNKYIETKDNLFYAVDYKPQNIFAYPSVIAGAYYALYESADDSFSLNVSILAYPSASITQLKIFNFNGADAEVLSTFTLGKTSTLFSSEQSGVLACSDGPGCYWTCYGNHYNQKAFYANTEFNGLIQRYFDVSYTPWELKEKVRNKIDNRLSYLSQFGVYSAPNGGFTCFSPGLPGKPIYNNYWYNYYPLEKLYAELDKIYPGSYGDFHAKQAEIYPALPEDSIIVFNGDLGYVYNLKTSLLLEIFDSTNKQIIRKYAHDRNNNLIAIEDQFGNKVTIERDNNKNATKIIAPNGQATKLAINNNNLTAIQYEDNSKYSYVYDLNSLITQKTTPNGNVSKYAYDNQGRITKITDANQGDWLFAKSFANNQTQYITTKPEGSQTIYDDQSDSNGNLKSTIAFPNGDAYI
jgi:YD repeat-containing protein